MVIVWFTMWPHPCYQSRTPTRSTRIRKGILSPRYIPRDIRKRNFSSQCQCCTSWTASWHQDNHYGVHLPPLRPPIVNRQPGRPKNKRIRGATEGGDRAKRVFHCGNCNKTGHSSRTCPDPPREA